MGVSHMMVTESVGLATTIMMVVERHGRLFGGHTGRPVLSVGRDVANGQVKRGG